MTPRPVTDRRCSCEFRPSGNPSAYVIPALRQAASATVAPIRRPMGLNSPPTDAGSPVAPPRPLVWRPLPPTSSIPSPDRPASYPAPSVKTVTGKTVVSIPHPTDESKGAYRLDLSAFKSNNLFGLQRHCELGRWVDPRDLEFGDVVNMVVSHEVFGPALRYYQFYKTVVIAGRQCPLFLCQITNGKKGPFNGDREFFQTSISFMLEDRPERKVFVNAAHIVAIVPPEHGLIFVQRKLDRKGSDSEQVRLRANLDHLADEHPGLLRRLCAHLTCTHGSFSLDPTKSTKDIKKFLQCGGEKCSTRGCQVCRDVMRLADVSLARHSKNRTPHRSTGHGKINPPEDLCAFVTGRGLHYSPGMGSETSG